MGTRGATDIQAVRDMHSLTNVPCGTARAWRTWGPQGKGYPAVSFAQQTFPELLGALSAFSGPEEQREDGRASSVAPAGTGSQECAERRRGGGRTGSEVPPSVAAEPLGAGTLRGQLRDVLSQQLLNGHQFNTKGRNGYGVGHLKKSRLYISKCWARFFKVKKKRHMVPSCVALKALKKKTGRFGLFSFLLQPEWDGQSQ